MTVSEAIARVDTLKPNDISLDEKLRWLSELDGRIKLEVIDTHEGGGEVGFRPYTQDNTDAVLLVPFPHDDIYIHWLSMQISYVQGELKKYNAAAALYNSALSGFKQYYNSVHMPRQARKRVF
ncbi:MAG: M20 family metallopeptidase [Ruminococcaceae bacterium]|nr:M20 family metallopeptidase [Oscillospiraceae bacterium]